MRGFSARGMSVRDVGVVYKSRRVEMRCEAPRRGSQEPGARTWQGWPLYGVSVQQVPAVSQLTTARLSHWPRIADSAEEKAANSGILWWPYVADLYNKIMLHSVMHFTLRPEEGATGWVIRIYWMSQ